MSVNSMNYLMTAVIVLLSIISIVLFKKLKNNTSGINNKDHNNPKAEKLLSSINFLTVLTMLLALFFTVMFLYTAFINTGK